MNRMQNRKITRRCFRMKCMNMNSFPDGFSLKKVLEGKMSVKEIYDEAAKLEMELTASSYNLIFIYLQEHRRNQSELEVEQFCGSRKKSCTIF